MLELEEEDVFCRNAKLPCNQLLHYINRIRLRSINIFATMANLLLAVVGIVLVLQGADKLTDGSVALARRFAISDMVIGLTVVAFGTSLPEFIVSLMASLRGAADMGVGNIVGSNLFNTLMIVGFTAIVAPIKVLKSTIYKDIPFTIIASVVLCALVLDSIFVSPETNNLLSRADGITLLCFFLIFMTYTFNSARSSSNPAETTGATGNEGQAAPQELPSWKVALFIIGGLIGLVLGGELFVRGASGIARNFGVSEAVIGLTLVAGGTSLPELATSIVAARKGKSGIAIGNVIGSNLFNVLWILGFCSCVSPMPIMGITPLDLSMLIVSSVLFWLFARTQHRIVRSEGILLVGIYVAYVVWLIMNL